MQKETRYKKIEVLIDRINNVKNELINDKLLYEEDKITLLELIKDLVKDLDKEVTILLNQNSQNKKW